jgi:ribonuclease D
VRSELAELSDKLNIPVENLLQPDIMRSVIWEAPGDVDAALAAAGARPWQRELVGPLLRQAIIEHPPTSTLSQVPIVD